MKISHNMVACYVVRPAGDTHEFLQLRRESTDYLGGTWSAIYGQLIDENEIAWRAALREMSEESGLAPIEFYRLATVRSFYIPTIDAAYLVPAFCAIVDERAAVILNVEHDAFRWVKRSEAAQQFLWATDRANIEEIGHDILDAAPCKPFLKIKID